MLAGFKSMWGYDSLETEDYDIPRCIQMDVRLSAKGGNGQKYVLGFCIGGHVAFDLLFYVYHRYYTYNGILRFLMTDANWKYFLHKPLLYRWR